MVTTNRALDILFVVVCVVILGFIASRSIGRSTPEASGFQPHELIDSSLPGEYSAWDKTFVLIVNSQCRFCTSSMPFYKRLQGAVALCPSVNLRVVSTEPVPTTRAYLLSHELDAGEVVSAAYASLKGSRYPTVLLVDRASKVIGLWQGVVQTNQENDVIALAKCTTPLTELDR